MGATNTTANYNLSQFISTDKPAWLQDYNGDMLKIDTAINAAKLAADTAQSTATNAQTDATSAVNSVSALASTVSSLSTAIGGINGTLNTITSLIGNGVPTTTDQTIIGAINELHSNQGNLANLQTTDKSSLVAAINEAAQSGGGGGSSISLIAQSDNVTTSTELDVSTAGDILYITTGAYDTVAQKFNGRGGSIIISKQDAPDATNVGTSDCLMNFSYDSNDQKLKFSYVNCTVASSTAGVRVYG